MDDLGTGLPCTYSDGEVDALSLPANGKPFGPEILLMYSLRSIIRHSLIALCFVLLYVLLNRPEVIVFSRIGFVTWYPAVGLAMALMLGVSPWYGVSTAFADVLASKLIYHDPILSFRNTVDAAAIAICYGAAACLLRGPLRIDVGLSRRRDVVRYVLVSATTAVIAAIIGVECVLADHGITRGDYRSSVVGWFLGDTIGLVGIAPFLLVHVFPAVRDWVSPVAGKPSATRAHSLQGSFTWGVGAEAGGQILTILAVLWAIFWPKSSRYDHFYLCFVPVIWMAMRQGVRRVVSGLLALNFGIVVAMHLLPPTVALFDKVALLMLILSAVGLIVGSEVSERERLALDLYEQTTYLDSLIENSPLGIVVLNRQGSIELANSAFKKLFQFDGQLDSIDIASTWIADDERTNSAQLLSQILAGNTLHRTVRRQRKDGQVMGLTIYGVPVRLHGVVRGAHLTYEDISEQIKANEAQQQHANALDRLVNELELRGRQITSLNEMGALLACSGTVNEASTVVASSVQTLFPESRSGALYLFRSSRDLLEAAVRWGKTDVLMPTLPSEACWALRRGQPHWSVLENDLTCRHVTQGSTAHGLCVPLVAQGNTLGLLYIEFERGAKLPPDPDRENRRQAATRLALSAASQIALSVASLQLRETLRDQAIRDPLTRLFNRRFLEEALQRELEIASRKKQPLALLLLDLDHFKRFNDTFGHNAGDMVLESVADLFRNFFRATDLCCRYGGEEFAIILPESSAQDAAIRADALRSELKNLRLQYKKQTLGQLTVSIGVAAFPEHGSTSLDLVRVADQCLYESKARGRDIVTMSLPQKA